MVYGLLSAFFILFCFFLFVLQKYLRITINLFLGVSVRSNPDEDLYLEAREVTFVTRDGIRLRGKFIDGLGESKGTIIFCHEYGSDMNSCVRNAEFLRDTGFNVLAFDFRGHGLSGNSPNYTIRQWTTEKELMDVEAAIRFVRNHGERHIGLLGVSRGATAGMIAASMDKGVCAVVMDGAFDSRATLEYYMRKWVSIFATVRVVYKNLPDAVYKLVSYLSIKISELRLRCKFPSLVKVLEERNFPLFMIHGIEDSYIDVSHANFLYGCASEPKELWLVPGAKHNESVIVREEEYRNRVSDFFEREFLRVKTTTGLRTDSGS